MNKSDRGSVEELEIFLDKHPETKMIEALLPDINGILRGKRIGRGEFETLYKEGLKACASTPFVDSRGEIPVEIGIGTRDGDPDVMSYPVKNTLAPIPWLDSPTAQVFTSLYNFDGTSFYSDPRYVLQRTCEKLAESGYKATVATEFEFYLLEPGNDSIPRPKLGTIPGTGLKAGQLAGLAANRGGGNKYGGSDHEPVMHQIRECDA